jgi:hypothetical protein
MRCRGRYGPYLAGYCKKWALDAKTGEVRCWGRPQRTRGATLHSSGSRARIHKDRMIGSSRGRTDGCKACAKRDEHARHWKVILKDLVAATIDPAPWNTVREGDLCEACTRQRRPHPQPHPAELSPKTSGW